MVVVVDADAAPVLALLDVVFTAAVGAALVVLVLAAAEHVLPDFWYPAAHCTMLLPFNPIGTYKSHTWHVALNGSA